VKSQNNDYICITQKHLFMSNSAVLDKMNLHLDSARQDLQGALEYTRTREYDSSFDRMMAVNEYWTACDMETYVFIEALWKADIRNCSFSELCGWIRTGKSLDFIYDKKLIMR